MSNYNKMSASQVQKVAIVTGSSSGIGRTTAIALAKEGVKVVIAARRDKEGEETLRLVKESGGDGIFVQTDVSNEDSVIALVEETIERYGRLDYAFNNAGVVFRVTKAVLPHMRKQHSGSIINISSIAGRIALPLYSAYVSTKFAIEGLSESMAYELQPFGINVAIIEPGAIKTNFRREQAAKVSSEDSPYSSMMQSPSKVIEEMLKHRLYPEEVAKTVIQAIENPKPKLRYIIGKDAEELIELRRKSSDEDLFWIMGQSILKKEEQVFLQNRGQVAAQEQFRIKKVAIDGKRSAI